MSRTPHVLRRSSLLTALLSAFALAVVACGSGGAAARDNQDRDPAPADLVTSDDGAVQLLVPDAALPEGLTRDDIHVTTRFLERTPELVARDLVAADALSESRVLAEFTLEPAGARFLQPIEVTAHLDRDLVAGPLVAILRSEDGATELLPVTSSDDADLGTIAATTTVGHFSDLMFVLLRVPAAALVSVNLTVPDPIPVGATFTASAEIVRLDEERIEDVTLVAGFWGDVNEAESPLRSRSKIRYRITPSESPSWRLEGTFGRDSFDSYPAYVIAPLFVSDRPASAEVRGPFTTTAEFTCANPGLFSLYYGGEAVISYAATPESPPAGLELPVLGEDHRVVYFSTYVESECVAVDPQPTSTTSVTPNRPPVVSPIEAFANPPITVYSITANDADGDILLYDWDGANCGQADDDDDETEYTWVHGDDGCEHGGVGHDDAAISVLISDGTIELRCTYVGAGTGKGPPCVQQ